MSLAYDTRETERTDFVAVLAKVCLVTFLISLGILVLYPLFWMALNGFDERGWVKRFTAHGRPGPYLRVLEEGVVERGDPIGVEHRPAHGTTVGTMFRALTTERHLLSGLQPAEGGG